MKHRVIIFFIAVFAATTFGGAFIDFIQAKSSNGNITIEWRTGEESNLNKFVVERKTVDGSFVAIENLQPEGDYSYYSYTDESAFKSSDVVYIYRIKIVENNGDYAYSKEVSVVHSISSVKRTWGSIKAMFR